ncbi:MAG: hypothetical protein PVH61_13815 [Candidatus Aminicenantes bacterium]|jgi:hypothetical protein
MVEPLLIGKKTELITQKATIQRYFQLLSNIADKTEQEVEDFCSDFGSLGQNVQNGLQVLAKATWANAKLMEKLIERLRMKLQ